MGVLWWCKWYYFLNSQLLADARWDGLMLTSSHPGPCRESWSHDIWGVESWLWLTLSHLYPYFMCLIYNKQKMTQTWIFRQVWTPWVSGVLWPEWRLDRGRRLGRYSLQASPVLVPPWGSHSGSGGPGTAGPWDPAEIGERQRLSQCESDSGERGTTVTRWDIDMSDNMRPWSLS